VKRLGQVLSKFLIQWYYGPDHPAKVRLWEQIWSLLGKPRLTIPYQEEARISVDIHDWVQKKIVEEGVYEPEVWEALAAHANENEVVWDIGGHVGGVAIRAALHPGVGAVHTFEPHPETYDALTTNIRLNPDLPIAAYNIALGNRRGYQKLEEGPSINSGQSSLGNTFGNRTFDVRCSTIDHLVSHEKVSAPTLMKIDVEGWEAKVLTGAEDRKSTRLNSSHTVISYADLPSWFFFF